MSRSTRVRWSTSIAACGAMVLGLVPSSLAAQTTLGQSFTSSTSPNTVLRRLTVGATGIVGSSSGAPYSANIYALGGGALVGPSLFSQVLGPNIAGFSLFPNLALTAGGSYVVLVGGGTGPFTTYFAADTYAGGSAYTCQGTTSCTSFGANDLNGFSLDFGPTTNDPRNMLGQSFTAPGGPNTLLQQLTVGSTGILGSSTGAPYQADIYALIGGQLSGGSLFSQMLGTSVGGFTLHPNLALTAGGTYVVLLSGGNGSFYSNFDADTYAGGSAYTCFDGRDCASFGANDLNGFQLQFGAATTVPEPGTSALLGIGLLSFGAFKVRRRRRQINV
ncbi:MAG: PEP-CTERM sorting domain-containing protein [Gemmatimonadaceae bacterium]